MYSIIIVCISSFQSELFFVAWMCGNIRVVWVTVYSLFLYTVSHSICLCVSWEMNSETKQRINTGLREETKALQSEKWLLFCFVIYVSFSFFKFVKSISIISSYVKIQVYHRDQWPSECVQISGPQPWCGFAYLCTASWTSEKEDVYLSFTVCFGLDGTCKQPAVFILRLCW